MELEIELETDSENLSVITQRYLSFGRTQKRLARRLAFNFWIECDREVKKQTGRTSYRHIPTVGDQLRLLNWKCWIEKYHVSLSFVVETLVPYWTKKIMERTRRPYKTGYGWGVKISTLTGPVSEDILKNRIIREFPDGENDTDWKNKQRLSRTQKQIKKLKGEDYVSSYMRAMTVRQRITESGLTSGRFTRRHYRGNPWL